jgi:hypothetical protein
MPATQKGKAMLRALTFFVYLFAFLKEGGGLNPNGATTPEPAEEAGVRSGFSGFGDPS